MIETSKSAKLRQHPFDVWHKSHMPTAAVGCTVLT